MTELEVHWYPRFISEYTTLNRVYLDASIFKSIAYPPPQSNWVLLRSVLKIIAYLGNFNCIMTQIRWLIPFLDHCLTMSGSTVKNFQTSLDLLLSLDASILEKGVYSRRYVTLNVWLSFILRVPEYPRVIVLRVPGYEICTRFSPILR